ncbi:MAG: hypothetical protein ACK55I_10710, partial [bacterium]
MALPEVEPDWDFDDDAEVLPEAHATVPMDEAPRSPPAQMVRMGVDLGGVIMTKPLARMLPNIRIPQDVARGLAAGAREWLEERVAKCGAEHEFIISWVGLPRLRGVFGRYFLGVGGLMGATGVPRGNLVWADSRVGKA